MAELTMKDLFRIHKEKFGFEPKITGINFFQSDETIERIAEAIEKGVPYIEDDVPDGAVI